MNLRDDPFGKGKTVTDLLREQESMDKAYHIDTTKAQLDAESKIASQGKRDIPLNEDVLQFMASMGIENPRPIQSNKQATDSKAKNRIPGNSEDKRTVDEVFERVDCGELTVESVTASLAKIAPSANSEVLRKMAWQVVNDHKGKK